MSLLIPHPTALTPTGTQVTPWDGTPIPAKRLCLHFQSKLDRTTNWRPTLSFVATDGTLAISFGPASLAEVLQGHPYTSWVVFDLPGLRNRLREIHRGHLEPLEKVLGDLLYAGRIIDSRSLLALKVIATKGVAKEADTDLSVLLWLGRSVATKGKNSEGVDLPPEELREVPKTLTGGQDISCVFEEAADILRAVSVIEAELLRSQGGPGAEVSAPFGLATIDLQTKAAWVFSKLSEEGVAFDGPGHLDLLKHRWAEVVKIYTEVKQAFPGVCRGLPPMPLEDFHFPDLLWGNLVVEAINRDLSREGSQLWFTEIDIERDLLLEAAGLSDVAGALVSLRQVVLEFNLCNPGLQNHGSRLRPQYRPLLSTGRVSTREPNIQGFSKRSGVRDHVIASPGNKLVSLDYQQMELNPLAVVCEKTGRGSSMANALRSGLKLHDLTASHILGIGYEEFRALKNAVPNTYDRTRGCAKAVNFGVAAGMGIQTLAQSSGEDYEVPIDLAEARKLIEVHRKAFPDVAAHVDATKAIFAGYSGPVFVTTLTGRTRACFKYTDALITQCQGLGADGALLALYRLWKAGFKVRVFIHDEVVLEIPEEKLGESVALAKDIMSSAMAEALDSDIPIGVDVAAGDSWGKMESYP